MQPGHSNIYRSAVEAEFFFNDFFGDFQQREHSTLQTDSFTAALYKCLAVFLFVALWLSITISLFPFLFCLVYRSSVLSRVRNQKSGQLTRRLSVQVDQLRLEPEH